MIKRIAIVLCVSALVAGCGGRAQLVGGPEVQVVPAVQLPPPANAVGSGQAGVYQVGPFDELEIDLFGVEGFRREVRVDGSGRVSYPLAGTIDATGMSIEQLAAAIAARLRGSYVRDPQVTVNLRESRSSFVTVEGAVREPGNYPTLGGMTLVRALAAAKGITDTADLQHAVIFRNVGGQRLAAVYSVRAIREGRYADPQVYANDVILVGESNARRIFRDALQAAPLFTAPLVAILQQ